MASALNLPALSPAGTGIRSSDSVSTTTSSGLTPFTHKEWVVPPRPKPGRKPATDTPPTKRKAQNRAAQRAFRERRAAKVEEMEEQMREKECMQKKEQNELLQHISRLESDVERFKGEVLAWQQRCMDWEREMLHERRRREQVEQELSRREKIVTGGNHQPTSSGLDAEESRIEDATMISCGNCTLDTRCECLEQVFNSVGHVTQNTTVLESSISNEQATSSNQDPSSNVQPSDFASLETDYTSRFTAEISKRSETSSASAEVPSRTSSNDHCGFCQDGAPCLCAQMDRGNQPSNLHRSSISRFTPPPAAGDVCRSSLAPPPSRPSQGSNNNDNNPCANGPGTCTRCQVDASSTLFCKSLATLPRSSITATVKNNNNNDNNVATSSTTLPTNNVPNNNKERGIYLSCADTYTTLSRHPRFQDATDEIDSWLGRLKTTLPKAEAGRPPMEIEAASVMGVLKFFDRRFGRE